MKPNSALLQASRAEQRRLRLLEAEEELAAEEAEALTITEEQRQTLLRPFAAVKAEFADLDGLRWTQTALRRRQTSHHNPTPNPTHNPANQAINNTTFAVLTNADLASFAPGDTIRIPPLPSRNRPRFPSPLIRGTTSLPDTQPTTDPHSNPHRHPPPNNHRDGTRQRSPIKGLFSTPSTPLTTVTTADADYEYTEADATPRPSYLPDLDPYTDDGLNPPLPPGLTSASLAPTPNPEGWSNMDTIRAPRSGSAPLLESAAPTIGGRGYDVLEDAPPQGRLRSPTQMYYSQAAIMGSSLAHTTSTITSTSTSTSTSASAFKSKLKSSQSKSSTPLHRSSSTSELTIRGSNPFSSSSSSKNQPTPAYTRAADLLSSPLPLYPGLTSGSGASGSGPSSAQANAHANGIGIGIGSAIRRSTSEIRTLPRRRTSSSSSSSSSSTKDSHPKPSRTAPSPPVHTQEQENEDEDEDEETDDERPVSISSSSLLDPPAVRHSPRRTLARSVSVAEFLISSSSSSSSSMIASSFSTASKVHAHTSPRAQLASLLVHTGTPSPSPCPSSFAPSSDPHHQNHHQHPHHRAQSASSTSSSSANDAHMHRSSHSHGDERPKGLRGWLEGDVGVVVEVPIPIGVVPNGTVNGASSSSSSSQPPSQSSSHPKSTSSKSNDKNTKHQRKAKPTKYPHLREWIADVSISSNSSVESPFVVDVDNIHGEEGDGDEDEGWDAGDTPRVSPVEGGVASLRRWEERWFRGVVG
ncbi:hypothetical protein BDN70DRAFT_936881 [Pholiota conissans]|uniref:Uncharacterized protein n=1 Tax=Pholiota conissans TaxID=109636 RepID=A0A9P5YRI0_9AGAR|nr:hypothetical protein BDN70DRAFT_936881 [Pholiota conissans]